MKRWEHCDKSNEVVTKYFSGVKRTNMKYYLLPTNETESIEYFIHYDRNDWKKEDIANSIRNNIIEIGLLCRSSNSNTLVSGIVPQSEKYNTKPIELNKHVERMS